MASPLDSLHPLEIKVLMALGPSGAGAPLSTEELAAATELEPSQLSMAVEWLLAKSLLLIDKETTTPIASLTPIGEQYCAGRSPIESVLAAAREAAGRCD